MPDYKPRHEYHNHETDDFGFPMNSNCCPACKALSRRMNEDFLQKVMTYDMTPGDLEAADDWSAAMNWRELEAEIIDIARQHGLELDDDTNGDKIALFRQEDGGVVDQVSLTEFAKALADRINAKAVKVKAHDPV